MKTSVKYWAVLVVTSTLLLGGCDAYMVVTQPVELFIADLASGSAASGAVIDFAYGNRATSPSARAMTDDDWLDRHVYRRQTTDEAGRASLLFDIAWIAGGLFADLDVHRDRVTGETYLFRIANGEITETLAAELTPGATIEGERFAVTILSVGEPTRVSADRLRRLRSGSPDNARDSRCDQRQEGGPYGKRHLALVDQCGRPRVPREGPLFVTLQPSATIPDGFWQNR